MDDEFLYGARPAVREEFLNELRGRLATQGTRAARGKPIDWPKARVVLAVVLAIGIVAACAREVLRPRLIEVGGVWVLEVEPVFERRIQTWESAGHAGSLPPERIPLSSAVESLPYELSLPREMPDGFALMFETVIPPAYPLWWLQLEWANEDGQLIELWCFAGEGGEVRAPRGAWKEIDLAGVRAVLLRGAFPRMPTPLPTANAFGFAEVETRWDKNGGIQLIWNAGGGHFELRTFGPYVSEEDLTRMAESMIE